MKNLIQPICLLVLINFDAISQKPDKEEWIQLFNGKDLTGWDIKINQLGYRDNYFTAFAGVLLRQVYFR